MPAPIYFEDHHRTLAQYDPGSDDIWTRDSTLPMIRVDCRYQVSSDGTPFYNPGMTALQIAQSVKNRVNWFFSNVGSQWPVDKPKAYALVWLGGVTGDGGLWLTNHPDDKFVGGAAVNNAIYPDQGISISRARVQSFMALVRAELDTLPYGLPTVHFMNQETLQNEDYLGKTNGTAGLYNNIILDPRYATTKVDGVRTAKQILEESAFNLRGEAIGAPDPAWTLSIDGSTYFNGVAPQNFDRVTWISQLTYAAFFYAIQKVWVEPIREAFGDDAIIGEWQNQRQSRLRPVRTFTPAPHYHGDNYYGGMNLSIPVNYCAPHTINPDYSIYNHPWSIAPGDWGSKFGISQGGDSVELYYTKLGAAVMKWNMEQHFRAGSSHKVAPSVALLTNYDKADVADITASLVGSMAWANNLGAIGFWLFEPDYWDYQSLGNNTRKTAIATLVDEYEFEASAESNPSISGPETPTITVVVNPDESVTPGSTALTVALSDIDNALDTDDFYVSVDLSDLGVDKRVSLTFADDEFSAEIDIPVDAELGTKTISGTLVYMGDQLSVPPSTDVEGEIELYSNDGGEGRGPVPSGTRIAITARIRFFINIEDLYGTSNTFGPSAGDVPGKPSRR